MKSLILLASALVLPSYADLLATEFPHLIIPLDSTTPDIAYGTQQDANVYYVVEQLMNFSMSDMSD
jgi:hypothetical protein